MKLIQLKNAAVSLHNKQIFKNPISLAINSGEKWAIVGASKNNLLKTLAGKFVVQPVLARTYPVFNDIKRYNSSIQFLEFNGVISSAHMSARYEFFKDEFDQSTKSFILSEQLNNKSSVDISPQEFEELIEKLKLKGLEDRLIISLSNGQTRRARLAKALTLKPTILIIDDPFLGLDPAATDVVSGVLDSLDTHLVIGLRNQDVIPDWVTHLAIVNEDGIVQQGLKHEVEGFIDKEEFEVVENEAFKKLESYLSTERPNGPIIEFNDVSVAYKSTIILQDLNLLINHGEKWQIKGENGSGKSTLLSLITADHPQSWNSKIKFNGVERKVGNQSYFSINKKIGFVSPELHSVFPKSLTLLQSLKTGFSVGNFLVPKLSSEQSEIINNFIDAFELSSKTETAFKDLSISDQKLVLFLRALVKNPDLLILDEALSVMDQLRIHQCKKLLDSYSGTLICIAHIENELPSHTHKLVLESKSSFQSIKY